MRRRHQTALWIAALLSACVARPSDVQEPASAAAPEGVGAERASQPGAEHEVPGSQRSDPLPDEGGLSERGSAQLVDETLTPEEGAQHAYDIFIGPNGPLAAALPAPWSCGKTPQQLLAKAACPKKAWPFVPPSQLPAWGTGAVRWTHGATLATREDQVLALDRDLGTLVAVVDAKVAGTVSVGEDPRQLVVAPDGAVWVALGRGRALVHVGPPGPGQVFGAKTVHALEDEASSVAMTLDGSVVLVPLHGRGVVRAFSAKGGAALAQVDVGPTPVGIATVSAGQVAVALRDEGVRYLSLAFGAGSLTMKAGPLIPYTNPPSAEGRGAFDLVSEPGGTTTFTVHVGVRPGEPADAVDVVRVGGTVAGQLVDEAPPDLPPRLPAGGPPPYYGDVNSEGPVQPWLSETKAGAKLGVGVNLTSTFVEQHPVAIAVHPSRRVYAVAFQSSDHVVLYSVDSGKAQGRVRTSRGVTGIAFSADGATLYTNASHAQRVSAHLIEPPGASSWVKLEQCPTWEVSYGESPFTPEQQAGRRLFHHAGNAAMAFQGDLACVSCHPGGGEDGVVWLGSQGMRQTPSLAGRLAGTAPFNWAGGSKDLKTNMQLTVHRLQGTGLCAQELAWLEAWMLAMKPHVRPFADSAPGKLAQQGKALFEAFGCSDCHKGGTCVDGQRHDVGTASLVDESVGEAIGDAVAASIPPLGFGGTPQVATARAYLAKRVAAELRRFDTPSLAGVWHTAPYLHDGSAKTLDDVLVLTMGKMGKTQGITPEQRKALVAYLETL